MMNILAQIGESGIIAIAAAAGSSGLTVGLLISLVKHANNGDIHINKRDTFMTGDKKDYVRKEVCEKFHEGLEKMEIDHLKMQDNRHKERRDEIRIVRKGLALVLSLQAGKPLPKKSGLDLRNQTEIFEAIVEDLNNEE